MSKENYRRITFHITTAEPLAAGEQVFVSGTIPAFGSWEPDGLPLTRVDDAIWSGFADILASERVEFKITRGTWQNQAVDEEGNELENQLIRPGNPDLTVNQFVTHWLDDTAATLAE